MLILTSIPTVSGDKILYDRLETGVKENIKTGVLGNMIADDERVRRAAANVVSSICSVELPRGEWTNIITNLGNNMKHEENKIRGVSIMTLGFICEKLKDMNFTLTLEMQESVITAIILGIKDSVPENRKIALQAFRDSLFSMAGIMEVKDYRNFIVKNIV